MKLRIGKKKQYPCFACKKNLVRKRGSFCRSCRAQLRNMKDGAF
jgi:hypothetical protein